MKAITKLKLWQKFAILGALAMVLVMVPTYQFVKESLVAINFATTERAGIPSLQSLSELARLTQRHQSSATALLSGNSNDTTEIQAIRTQIDAAMSVVSSEFENPAVSTESSRVSWENFVLDWNEVVKQVSEGALSVIDSDDEHRALAGALFEMMDEVSTHTLLSLDPDVDTHYLHQIGASELPQLSKSLAWLRDEGARILSDAQESADTGENVQFDAADQGRIMSNIDKMLGQRVSVVASAAKVSDAVPETGIRLEEPLKAVSDSTLKAVQLIRQEILSEETLTFSPLQYASAYDELFDQIYAANVVSLKELDQGLANRISGLRTSQFTVSLVIGVLIVIAVLAGLLIVRSVTVPVNHLVNVMQRVREGDADARSGLETVDEIGGMAQQFDSMLDEREAANRKTVEENEQLNESVLVLLQGVAKLAQRDLTSKVPVAEDVTGAVSDAINMMAEETSKVLAQVIAVARGVAGSSNQVREKSDTAMNVALDDKLKVEQTAIELQEAAKTMAEIARLALATNESAAKAIQTTDKAQETVLGTVAGISGIRDTIRETEKRIKRLGERSQEIGGVVSLINNIAERTHILALNASMHAASAGEAGRGFAVVANEVQRLAESAREATGQIAGLVNSIQTETADTVSTMNDAITKVVEGTKLAERAGVEMGDTRNVTVELVEYVKRIDESSKQQAGVAQRLVDRASELQSSAQLTYDTLQSQAKSTAELTTYSDRLTASVQVFKLSDEYKVEVEVSQGPNANASDNLKRAA